MRDSPATAHPGRQQEMVQLLESPPPKWEEMQAESWSHSFSLIQPCPLWAFWRWSSRRRKLSFLFILPTFKWIKNKWEIRCTDTHTQKGCWIPHPGKYYIWIARNMGTGLHPGCSTSKSSSLLVRKQKAAQGLGTLHLCRRWRRLLAPVHWLSSGHGCYLRSEAMDERASSVLLCTTLPFKCK